ncbi:SHOCT domain-containing protein [Glutamicibacter sp.]|uniref:SHOCT domain-containing protein n=1 Tax=Glutamicibacter sp. TaxID=1931995 RepID=UPI002B4722C3|nr:SHOCT domain-containing protein [Glutamicibacter sp.]HJX78631.1 SHOCT domain-containing protein [Glutamicibacter sp.]
MTQLIDSDELQDFGFNGEEPMGGSNFVDAAFNAIPLLTGIFAVLFVLFVGFIIYIAVRNYRATRKAGFDPFTLQTDLATRLARSQTLAPKKTTEQKLSELDDLLARAVISHEEYTQARSQALRD